MYLQVENVAGHHDDTSETASTFLMMQVEIGGVQTTQASIFSVYSRTSVPKPTVMHKALGFLLMLYLGGTKSFFPNATLATLEKLCQSLTGSVPFFIFILLDPPFL